MKNHKQLLADFYLALLAIPDKEYMEWFNLEFKSLIRNELADMINENPETIQRIFERMAAEDAKF